MKADNWKKGKAIRVTRGFKFAKHSNFAPKEGYRYDGIYKLVEFEAATSEAHGYIVYKYLLRRDDESPLPWTEGKHLLQAFFFSW